MTIALDRPTAPIRSVDSARSLKNAPGQQGPGAAASSDAVTVTVTVTLPAGTGDVEAALIADDLRTHAQRQTFARQGRTTVSVSSPSTFTTAPGRGPQTRRTGSVSPLRPRRGGVVSPTSPARRDAEIARRRALAATAVSPSSPSAPIEGSLVLDLFGRRVRIDGQDIDLTYKEFELLSHLAKNARRTVSREELMENVWADAPEETGERTVDVHVRRVRTKLGRYRKLISTVRGSGYRLDPGSDVTVLS